MKKEVLIISILVIAILTTSCSSLGETLQEVWEGSMSAIYEVTIAPTNYIEIEEIVEAIENRDADTLKSLFSQNALEEAQYLDENIEKLFEYYQGELKYCETHDYPSYTEEEADYGYRCKIIGDTYTVKTTETNYLIYVSKCTVNTEDPEEVGIYSIYVIYQNSLNSVEHHPICKPGVHVNVW